MQSTLKKFHQGISRAFFLCGGTISVLFLIMVCLKIASMPLTFDEYFHAHYLWLISIGRVPHVDFFCCYSVLGYVIVRPFFQLFPETIYSVFGLRFFGLCFFIGMAVALADHARRLRTNWLWGVLPLIAMLAPKDTPFVANFRTDAYAALAAVIAMVMMFREPSCLRSGLATGLSVLSVLIMAKYAYPLFFALLAYTGYVFFNKKRERRSLILAALAGGVLAMVLAQVLLLTSGVWLWNDQFWSNIFLLRFFIYCARTETSLIPQITMVAYYFATFWWIALLILAGLSGWLITEWKRRGVQLWVGIAIIVGLAVSWGTCKVPFLQFFIPGLYCLALFVPYIARLLKRPILQWAGTCTVLIMSAVMLFSNFRQVAAELTSGSSFQEFEAREELLKHIPRSERVVGLYKTHPIFREDQTFVTYDEEWGKPKGFLPILPKSSRAFACFQPEYLEQSLENSPPPATISLNSRNYPPGWNQVLSDYLTQHAGIYEKGKFLDRDIFIRKDLGR